MSYLQVARKRDLDHLQLVNMLEGELDRIVMKCLEEDQSHRYESVSSLTRDIQKCLNPHPPEKPIKTKLGPNLEPGEIAYLDDTNWLVTNRRIVSHGSAFRLNDVQNVKIVSNEGTVRFTIWLPRIGYLIAIIGTILCMVHFNHYQRPVSLLEQAFWLALYNSPGLVINYLLKKIVFF
jgi:serine/threonine protein kinase